MRPGSQAVHDEDPLIGLNLPMTQAVQVLLPVYPGGQVQLDILLLAA